MKVPLDLTTPGRYHVVGIGGPGMSAIALVLAEMGHDVSGSDIREAAVLERLRAAGVTVTVGHDAALVEHVDAVTASTAIPARNVEMERARELGVPALRRAGMLASICACAKTVAVAGTHGKTTTTAMLAMILREASMQPSFLIGGDVHEVGAGAHWSGHELLVVEADESDGTFLELPLHGTIVTNVETDHLDHYGTFAAIREAFDRYLDGVPGPRVVGIDE
ncbi:MAG TPA: Mur ligase domain-containing protein, partial [Acidimicrobiales bacterium]